jgi:NlpC/P60 family
MSWDKVGAVNYLRWHANTGSHGDCARYVREAIERGGIKLDRTASAKDYGSSLLHAGFREVSGTFPQRGDVVVIEAIPRHPHGHMAMFDGDIWISDFKQQHGFYPGPDYRAAAPRYKMYRHD